MNNKAYLTTKVSLFMANYRRELRIEVDIRRKGKMEKGESNRIFRKNEEGTRRSRDSIKKNTGRDEKASR